MVSVLIGQYLQCSQLLQNDNRADFMYFFRSGMEELNTNLSIYSLGGCMLMDNSPSLICFFTDFLSSSVGIKNELIQKLGLYYLE